MTTLQQLRTQAIQDQQIPEPVRKFLAAGAPLDDIRLDAYGRWFHQGDPFINKKLARLFHQSLRCTEQGTWFLHIAPYSYPVTVELTDRFVDRIQQLQIQTRVHFVGEAPDDWVPIHIQNLYTDGQDLLVTTHNERPVRFVEAAYRDLLENLEWKDEQYHVRFHDQSVPVNAIPEGFFHPRPK